MRRVLVLELAKRASAYCYYTMERCPMVVLLSQENKERRD